MKLPRPIFLRIRRAIQRQLMNAPNDRSTLRAIEEWTGHRGPSPQPPGSMKRTALILILIAGAALALGVLTGCPRP